MTPYTHTHLLTNSLTAVSDGALPCTVHSSHTNGVFPTRCDVNDNGGSSIVLCSDLLETGFRRAVEDNVVFYWSHAHWVNLRELEGWKDRS